MKKLTLLIAMLMATSVWAEKVQSKSVGQAMQVLDSFMLSFNSRDMEDWLNNLETVPIAKHDLALIAQDRILTVDCRKGPQRHQHTVQMFTVTIDIIRLIPNAQIMRALRSCPR